MRELQGCLWGNENQSTWRAMKNKCRCDTVRAKLGFERKKKTKTSIGKPISGRSGICKIDVIEPQTLETNVDTNKS